MLNNAYNWFMLKFIGNITWTGVKRFMTGRDFDLTLEDREQALAVLFDNNCLCLTRRKTHLTTYLIAIGNFLLRGAWGHWSHACFNFEAEASTLFQIKFVEAIGKGVVPNDPVEVMCCDSFVAMVPHFYGVDEELTVAWDKAVQNSALDIGKKYDTRLNIKDNSRVSCVEEILDQLKEIQDYEKHFPGLIALIEKEKNLTPDMLYDCGDFKVLFEVRR